jgi:hypothetical protein
VLDAHNDKCHPQAVQQAPALDSNARLATAPAMLQMYTVLAAPTVRKLSKLPALLAGSPSKQLLPLSVALPQSSLRSLVERTHVVHVRQQSVAEPRHLAQCPSCVKQLLLQQFWCPCCQQWYATVPSNEDAAGSGLGRLQQLPVAISAVSSSRTCSHTGERRLHFGAIPTSSWCLRSKRAMALRCTRSGSDLQRDCWLHVAVRGACVHTCVCFKQAVLQLADARNFLSRFKLFMTGSNNMTACSLFGTQSAAMLGLQNAQASAWRINQLRALWLQRLHCSCIQGPAWQPVAKVYTCGACMLHLCSACTVCACTPAAQ